MGLVLDETVLPRLVQIADLVFDGWKLKRKERRAPLLAGVHG